MTAKSNTLDQVVRWIHNDGAAAVQDDFWKNAADRIQADVWNLDATLAGWDEAHALVNPSLWFYACLREGRLWAEDDQGYAGAEASYQVALALANGQARQGAIGQESRPYPGASATPATPAPFDYTPPPPPPLELEQPRGPDSLDFTSEGA